MTIQEYLNLYNLSFEEISENHHEIFIEIFENEKYKNWLVPIEDKLDKFNDVQVESDIKFIIDKLKSEEIFSIDDSEKLTLFVSKINKIVRVANRINNFKQDTILDGGSGLKLYDLFNFIKSISKFDEFNYTLNKNLSSFKPYIFSLIKHCQNSLLYPIYYPFWQNISKYVLKLNVDYDSFTKLYNSFPEADRTLVFGSYFGTITKLLINNIKGNTAINQTEVIAYLKKEIINIPEYTTLLDNLNLTENKMKKYWIYSPGEQAYKWEEFYDEDIMALGWDEMDDLSQYSTKESLTKKLQEVYNDTSSQKNNATANFSFANIMNIGDIVIVKKGLHTLLGYGEIRSDYYYSVDREDYKHCRDVTWKKNGQWDVSASMVLKTLTEITSYNTEKDPTKKYYQYLLDIMENENDNDVTIFKEVINLLEYKKQIILQGPPGTGKTREAELIAKEMLGLSDIKELENNDQYKLVQFHPSYTYEDFVRGIIAESNGDKIEYKNVNKTLGLFAEAAYKNYDQSTKTESQISYKDWIDEQFDNFVDTVQTSLDNTGEYRLTDKVKLFELDDSSFYYTGDSWFGKPKHRMKFSDIKEGFINNVADAKSFKALPNTTGSAKQHYGYYFKVLNDFQNSIKSEFKTANKSISEPKKYVLIIDEINRANLSSVLGELIYALEYREKAVESMYSVESSVLDNKNEIILPPNLYIIGTMNTADRSVGHIDYAIRRRFAFVDVPPENLKITQGLQEFDDILFEKVAAIFDTNLSPEFKKEDVQLGHSYFIDKRKDGGTMAIRLQYEIKPILLEYVKDGILVGEMSDNVSVEEYINSLTIS